MMRKSISIPVLMILPIILIILGLMYQSSRGNFFMSWRYDPSYLYLINSLNLAQLNGVGHIDHPGTTVQLVGSIVVKIIYTLQGGNTDIVIDVFSRPEFYLKRINAVLIFMVATGLFLLGLIVYKQLGNIYPALLLQTTPFFFSNIFLALSDVSPESLLIFIILLFIATTVSIVNEKNWSTKISIKYVILYGLICGFGIVTKLTFVPLIIIPIILIPKVSFKTLFIISTAISFLIFVSPAISGENIKYFFNWVKNLTTHSGTYGTGAENYVDASMYLKNIKSIFTGEFIFTLSYLLILTFIILQFFPQFKSRIRENKYYKLLIGLFIVITLQILLVAKHYNSRYMLIAYLLSVLSLFVANSMFADLVPKYFARKKFIYVSLILFAFLIVQIFRINRENKINKLVRNESRNFINYIEDNYKQSTIVNSYGSSSLEFGLFLGVFYAGTRQKEYATVLKKLHPNYFHYNKFAGEFSYENINDIRSRLNNTNKIIFQCDDKDGIKDFIEDLRGLMNESNVDYKIVYENLFGETVYEISIHPFRSKEFK